jgi:hypothetical protein
MDGTGCFTIVVIKNFGDGEAISMQFGFGLDTGAIAGW